MKDLVSFKFLILKWKLSFNTLYYIMTSPCVTYLLVSVICFRKRRTAAYLYLVYCFLVMNILLYAVDCVSGTLCGIFVLKCKITLKYRFILILFLIPCLIYQVTQFISPLNAKRSKEWNDSSQIFKLKERFHVKQKKWSNLFAARA